MKFLTVFLAIQLLCSAVLCGPAPVPEAASLQSKQVAGKPIVPSFRSVQGDAADAFLPATNKRPSPRIIATTISDLLREIKTGNDALNELGTKADGISGALADLLKSLGELPAAVEASSASVTDKIAESTSTLDGRLTTLGQEIVTAVVASNDGSNKAMQDLVDQTAKMVSLLESLVGIVGP